MHISTKTYGHDIGLSCAFRQHRAHSHCRFIHGYSISVRLEFEAEQLDSDNWVVDFGSLKSFKQQLETTFDHKLLVAEDDPLKESFELLDSAGLAQIVIVPATGCEAFAEMIYEVAELWLLDNGYAPRVRMRSVTVSEHGANSASYTRESK